MTLEPLCKHEKQWCCKHEDHASGRKSESGNGSRICSKVKIFSRRFSERILCISRDASHIWDSFQQVYYIICEKMNLQRIPNFKIFWQCDVIMMWFWCDYDDMLKIYDTMLIWRHIIIITSKSHHNHMILSIFSYFFAKNVSFNPIESKKYFCFESSIQNDISFSNHVERLFRIDNASNYRTKCVRFSIQKHHIIITSKSYHNHIIL